MNSEKKERFGENIKFSEATLQIDGGRWCDYDKYMQDVTYFHGLSGLSITFLDTLL